MERSPMRHRWLARGGSLVAGVRAAVERTAFWLAIGLVVGYPASLLAGQVTTVPWTALLGLLGVHVLAVAVGHRYDPDGAGRRRNDGVTGDDLSRPSRTTADD